MRSIRWLLVAGLIGSTTAGCTEPYGYPNTAYNSGYSNNRSYNTGNVYTANPYQAYPSGPSYAYAPRRHGPNGDYDRDGIPNKYDRDANGDGVPDRYQR